MNCEKCEEHKRELKKLKHKYKTAKSGLTKDERDILIELICNEQLIHLLARNEYDSDKYCMLEKLKAKIRIV